MIFEMLPCPFCGADEQCVGDNETKIMGADTWFVICENCTARGPHIWDRSDGSGFGTGPDELTEQECTERAIASWNKRASDPTP